MAYRAHNAFEDNYHSDNYHGHDHEDSIKYHSDDKYNSNDDPFSAGYRTHKEEEEKKKKEMSEFEKQLEAQHKPKYEKKEDDPEHLKKKAAEEINREISQFNPVDVQKKKSTKNSIEEAIESAIKEEKKVLVLNR